MRRFPWLSITKRVDFDLAGLLVVRNDYTAWGSCTLGELESWPGADHCEDLIHDLYYINRAGRVSWSVAE